MPGNRLGSKKVYLYTPDAGTATYLISRDEDLAIAGFGAGSAAPVEFDPANPPTPAPVTPPKGFQPRVVFIQSSTDGARKEMIAFSPTADLYASTSRTAVGSLDSDTSFVTTGRKGEKLSFA